MSAAFLCGGFDLIEFVTALPSMLQRTPSALWTHSSTSSLHGGLVCSLTGLVSIMLNREFNLHAT